MSLKWPPPIYSHYKSEMISTADNEPSGSRMTSAITLSFFPSHITHKRTPLLTHAVTVEGGEVVGI